MRRFLFAAIIGGAAVAMSLAAIPAANAQARSQEVTHLQNSYFNECLTSNGADTVSLAPCASTPLDRWIVERGGIGQIRNLVTGQCLTDVDSNTVWNNGSVLLTPCETSPRQLWRLPDAPTGLIRNVNSGRFLKVNDYREPYVGDPEADQPIWYLR